MSALTTIGAAVSAYDRQKYLAASYAAMKANLERLKERYEIGGMSLEALVATAEDLMESEHADWIDRMSKTIRADAGTAPQSREAKHELNAPGTLLGRGGAGGSRLASR